MGWSLCGVRKAESDRTSADCASRTANSSARNWKGQLRPTCHKTQHSSGLPRTSVLPGTDLSFATTVRARLVTQAEAADEPCNQVFSSTDLTIKYEVLLNAEGPTSSVVGVDEDECAKGSTTLRALIPRSDKEDPIFQGAEYQIQWYSIPPESQERLPIGPPRTKKWAGEYLCPPASLEETLLPDDPCLLGSSGAASGGAGLKVKGATIFAAAVPKAGGARMMT